MGSLYYLITECKKALKKKEYDQKQDKAILLLQ
jgi:hypothetical protein